MKFRLGFIVNPYAGVGGPIAQKGSDAMHVQNLAKSGEVELSAVNRAKRFLEKIQLLSSEIEFVCVPGPMGDNLFQRDGGTANMFEFNIERVDCETQTPSSAGDTQRAVKAICRQKIDLLVFVGGDGTARDICACLPTSQIVLGLPAGVKMHSGVFAVNPEAAASVVCLLVRGELNQLVQAEVRDIDEEAFRKGVVKSRYYGEMTVPDEVRFVQQVKQGGLEVEELVALDIADHLKEVIEPDTVLIVGPGSTTLKVIECWGLHGTLLGVDVISDGQIILRDASASDLESLSKTRAKKLALVITAIGAQGHIIGRGNQQLSPRLLNTVGRENVFVVATKTKLLTFDGRPLNIDSGDPEIDARWSGHIPVITGYHDQVYYPLGHTTC